MKKRCYIILLQIIILGVFFTSCRRPFPSDEEMANYTLFIQKGDLENVKKYYRKFGKGFLNTYGPWNCYINPLELAIYYHHYDIADFLISKGADVNGISPSTNREIIFTGIYRDDYDFVKYLIGKKAKTTDFDYPLITSAAFQNNLPMVELILEATLLVDEKDIEGFSALSIAAGNGYLEIVKYLLEHGANINSTMTLNDTPLITAIMNEHIEVAEYLISQGADISIIDSEGHDALWFANELGLKIKGLND